MRRIRLHAPSGRFTDLTKENVIPLPAGEFFSAAIVRRNLTNGYVAEKTGIPLPQIEGLIAGTTRFTPEICASLEVIFPTASQTFLEIQEWRDHHEGSSGSFPPQLEYDKKRLDVSVKDSPGGRRLLQWINGMVRRPIL